MFAFYRDVLGMPEEFYVESEGNALVIALQAGRATLEIVNPAQRRLIDELVKLFQLTAADQVTRTR